MINVTPHKLYFYFVIDWIKTHIDKDDLDNTIKNYAERCIEEDEDFSMAGLAYYIEEIGFTGSMCYPCYDEFLNCEYQDKEYIKELTKKYFG